MMSSSFTMSTSAILRLLAIGAMLPLITSFPVFNHTWIDPCNGLSAKPPNTVSMLEMMKSLTGDAQNVQQKAEELVKFYTTVQKDEPQARVTPLYVKDLEKKKLANFPSDNEYDNSDNLTVGLLNDYKQLSRVAIYCEDAIKSNKMYALTKNAETPIHSLTETVTMMLCHLDLILRNSSCTVDTFEDSNEVLDRDVKTALNKHHEFYEYIIFRDTKKYASVLHNKYSNISNRMSSDKKE